ncbi:branched-chain amino acid ABC transporter substrate-binding protein [Neomegalonema sp.]|uniref:branched-chain amino acid ABC transporter substrate-binding protein n=1 Tax=Neomegalonema sp. TaxID=2039713 RepID=UPI002628EECB|nr:branched-chain amino acid ABC transporter substrate-binding protein [Neomegalonema sp.]MDD2869878.1 branched-chain amino acid ABC transporter substrate-binding protein [Neomegalonema sp.]
MRLTATALALMAGVTFGSVAQAEIVIGVIAPVTGGVAAYGIQVKEGVESAVDVINKAGGVLGQQLVVRLEDDAGEARQAVSAANNLLGAGVHFVIGPVTSGNAMPVSDLLAENGVLMITPTATTPALTQRGLETIFRTCGRDDQQALVLAEHVLRNLPEAKVAVIHDKAPYGKGLADAFKEAVNKGGVTEVLYETVTPGEKDFSVLVGRLKAAGADTIYFGGYHPEAGLLARQLKDQGVEARILGGEGLSTNEYWAIATEAGEGTLFTSALDTTDNPIAKEAVDDLTAKGFAVEPFTINAYAAVQVLKAGIEAAADAEDAAAVAEALKGGLEIPTVLGALSYDENGDLKSPAFVVYEWVEGASVPASAAVVEPAE